MATPTGKAHKAKPPRRQKLTTRRRNKKKAEARPHRTTARTA